MKGKLMSRKRIASVSAYCVFGVGLIGIYFLVLVIKDGLSYWATFAVAMVAFCAVWGLAELTERVVVGGQHTSA
jgi:hypothetical protein